MGCVQQGMDLANRTARRYHWFSEHVRSFVNQPHGGTIGDIIKENVLDMTARESENSQKVSLDLVKDGIGELKNSVPCSKASRKRP